VHKEEEELKDGLWFEERLSDAPGHRLTGMTVLERRECGVKNVILCWVLLSPTVNSIDEECVVRRPWMD